MPSSTNVLSTHAALVWPPCLAFADGYVACTRTETSLSTPAADKAFCAHGAPKGHALIASCRAWSASNKTRLAQIALFSHSTIRKVRPKYRIAPILAICYRVTRATKGLKIAQFVRQLVSSKKAECGFVVYREPVGRAAFDAFMAISKQRCGTLAFPIRAAIAGVATTPARIFVPRELSFFNARASH